MRIFVVCGHELGLGFVIARRLVAESHQVNVLTGFDDLIPNLSKNGLNPVLGEITDDDPQRLLGKADGVIDSAFSVHVPKEEGSHGGTSSMARYDEYAARGHQCISQAIKFNSERLSDFGQGMWGTIPNGSLS